MTVQPEDHGRALLNPGMGWNFPYFTDNGDSHYGGKLAADDQLEWFPGCNAVSFRTGWGRIEPQEGQFNWAYTDDVAAKWVAKGRQVVYCWIAFSTVGSAPCTPTWVRDAGAKGFTFPHSDTKKLEWNPQWDDPVYLRKLEDFIKAAAARYDGQPHVAFIEIGSLGTWGEGHAWTPEGGVPPISEEMKKTHLDLWRKYFTRTPLVVNDDYLDEAVKYASQRGYGLGEWSVMVQGGDKAYFHQNFAHWFWPAQIVALENQHYHFAMQKNTWGDGSKYLSAVEDYHASWARIHGWPEQFLNGDEKLKLPGNRALVDRINRRIGYRLQVLMASWIPAVRAGDAASFSIRWRNAGVAPCYGGGFAAISVKDGSGRIVATGINTGFNVRSLRTSASAETAEPQDVIISISMPAGLRAGSYSVFVSIGHQDGQPVLALPHEGDDGQRRYRLGAVDVIGK